VLVLMESSEKRFWSWSLAKAEMDYALGYRSWEDLGLISAEETRSAV